MLTFRSLSLTATSLLLSLAAAAQTTAAEAPLSPANAEMLSWFLKAALGAAGIISVLAFIAMTTVAAGRRADARQAASGATPPAPHTW